MNNIKDGEIIINPDSKYKVENVIFEREDKTKYLSTFDKYKNEWKAELILYSNNYGKKDVPVGSEFASIKLLDLDTSEEITLRNVQILKWDENIKLKFTLISREEIK